ncbi:SPOR domain-containing protein [Sphingomonas sp. 28-63-12]|uniref:SPOR domain-containing protein n=1 Tax=Sphingomonas sp. 28-63-12 TaxID=1970434 RepID=UPI000BCE0A32|nr:MAG: hypothetical protein B7Y47_04430 [Sphingomonas sp. 28-63-12]
MPLTIRAIAAATLLASAGLGSVAFAGQSADMPPPGEGPRGTSQAVPGAERYDSVGYAVPYDGGANPAAITAAHPTLPIGGFAEVTALDSGKTILVLIADHALATADHVIALSPGALHLLGADGTRSLGVRVRRVNPLGGDQQALRDGGAAGTRSDAPPVLLTALRKRLPAPPRSVAVLPQRPIKTTSVRASAATGAPYPVPGSSVKPAPQSYAPPAATSGAGYYVQIAALSSGPRAQDLAQMVGGAVKSGGGLYRVRLGPYADQSIADRARSDVARRGYGDARIIRE